MTSKKCRICQVTKPLTEFYAHRRMAGGHLSECKTCKRAEVDANRQLKAEHYRAYDRARASLPHRVAQRAKYAKTARGKRSRRLASRFWRATRQPQEMRP